MPRVHEKRSQPWIFGHTGRARLRHPLSAGSPPSWLVSVHFWSPHPAPPTARAKSTAHKNTHKMLVCFVWTGRGFPGCLVIIYWLNYISFLLLCLKKKSKLAFLQLPPFFLFISCCGDKSRYFFRSTTCTHNQSYINQHFQFKYCTEDRNKGGNPGLTR